MAGQLPLPGETVPGGSQIMVYLSRPGKKTETSVPDFIQLNLPQAAAAAGKAGLRLEISGNPDLTLPLRVIAQEPQPDAAVSPGSVVRIRFADPEAHD